MVMNELALFAGAGGGILGGKLLGWRTVCAVEWEPYPASVLCARQNDGLLPPFPVWDDVQTFDGKPWRGIVDVISGGFPCQDISAIGGGGGITGAKSSMWKHMARIIREVGPRFVFVENSPMLATRGLSVVLGDLAQMGFDAKWCVLGAKNLGAKHKRDRMWIMGYTNSQSRLQTSSQTSTIRSKWKAWDHTGWQYWERTPAPNWSIPEAVSDRVPNGMAYRMDRFKAIGNGQSPVVAATAWRILNDR
jgi:DNA (cytosine-5)-methyltransferase 1